MKVFMTAFGKVMVTVILAGLLLPCRIRAEEVQGRPFRRSEARQAAAGLMAEILPPVVTRTASPQTDVRVEVHGGLRNGRAGGHPSAPHAVPVKKAGSASGKPSKLRPGPAAEPAEAVQPAVTADIPAASTAGAGGRAVTAVPPPGDDSGADTGGASPGSTGSGTIDLAALEEELGRILDEGIEEALAEQRQAFEKEYARLWDSRSFWRRAAIGEGGAIVACLLGGFLVWNWSGR